METTFDATSEEEGTNGFFHTDSCRSSLRNMYLIAEAISTISVSEYVDENTTDLTNAGRDTTIYFRI